MINGIPTAYRTAASDARGSSLNSESGASDPASRAQVLPGPAANRSFSSRGLDTRGDPWEASDWPSLRKATQPWLFDFRNDFPADLPRVPHPVTLLFLLLEPTSPNSTCSRADYLCIIGFAYRAAEARSQNESGSPQFSRVNRVFLPRSHLLAQIVVFGRWANQ
jgi:hypothetical protein